MEGVNFEEVVRSIRENKNVSAARYYKEHLQDKISWEEYMEGLTKAGYRVPKAVKLGGPDAKKPWTRKKKNVSSEDSPGPSKPDSEGQTTVLQDVVRRAEENAGEIRDKDEKPAASEESAPESSSGMGFLSDILSKVFPYVAILGVGMLLLHLLRDKPKTIKEDISNVAGELGKTVNVNSTSANSGAGGYLYPAD